MVKRILLMAMILLFVSVPVPAEGKPDITKEDVLGVVRDNFILRKTEFTIEVNSKVFKEIGTATDLLHEVIAYDDKAASKDGDFLGVSVIRWREDWKYDLIGNVSITITTKYRTTQQQEKILDEKIKRILQTLNLSKATDYDKVKAIHDYIIKRVTFDHTYKRYTAYSAIIDRSAVCEGYAAAAYRMFIDAGVDSRIISGTANGEAHIWNIVKVNGKWYNIDLTWDDPDSVKNPQAINYDYFLKSEKEFKDHLKDPEYATMEFLNTYPVAENSYD